MTAVPSPCIVGFRNQLHTQRPEVRESAWLSPPALRMNLPQVSPTSAQLSATSKLGSKTGKLVARSAPAILRTSCYALCARSMSRCRTSRRIIRLLQGRSILVVEDEMMVLMNIEDVLRNNGCTRITSASTVEEAVSVSILNRSMPVILCESRADSVQSGS